MSQHEPWQLGENPDALYERYLVPAMFGPWAADLVTLAAPQPGERVLDVACGTGVVARLVAPYVGATGHVVGLDLDTGRLAVGGCQANCVTFFTPAPAPQTASQTD